jgi:hypothetical protein
MPTIVARRRYVGDSAPKNVFMYRSTPVWSSTSSATTPQLLQLGLTSRYISRKNAAARVGLR